MPHVRELITSFVFYLITPQNILAKVLDIIRGLFWRVGEESLCVLFGRQWFSEPFVASLFLIIES